MLPVRFNLKRIVALAAVIMVSLTGTFISKGDAQQISKTVATDSAKSPTLHKTIKVDGLDIFYREAGSKTAPTILLLHGYPTSSHMFRNLIRDLSDQYHLLAPDYPGFGRSEQPPMSEFDYTFEGTVAPNVYL